MVTIRKRTTGNQTYYYLEHSIKIDKKVEKREKYLGKVIPKDIEKIKKMFLFEIYKTKWYNKFDIISKNYKNEFEKLPESIKEKQIEQFMIKFTYNTNKIEGGTLSYRDTSNLLHDKITPSGKPIKDIKEAESHKRVFYEILKYKKDINLGTVLEWHRMLLNDTKPDIAGGIRNYEVAVGGSKVEFPLAIELNALLKDFFKWYEKNKNILHPVELAALTHLKFVSIHPFGDGNGRISRLIMNFVLKKHNYPMLDITYVNRNNYYNALERSQINKDPYPFLNHIFKRYLKNYKKYLKN
ncbi:MAG: Fic family protein [Nanoarchaeota archaeon]|nr:Fic family protein [Nanoarchaeota archaeon]